MRPALLGTSFHEKVWGSTRLAPWYPDVSGKIGEAWFEADPPLPLLVKFIFTTEALSVQVHPDDDYARRYEHSRGKTEMWHIVRADPGARIALGLTRPLTPERLRTAAQSGEIEDFLNWVEVRPGDSFHIPAGTIHAIGAGIVLCEIQQNSDVTYRLYDYGRPRELHLDRALEVSTLDAWRPIAPPPGFLAHCQYYAVERIEVPQLGWLYEPPPDGQSSIVIVLEGEGAMGDQVYRLGQAWHIPENVQPFSIAPARSTRLLRAYVPAS